MCTIRTESYGEYRWWYSSMVDWDDFAITTDYYCVYLKILNGSVLVVTMCHEIYLPWY